MDSVDYEFNGFVRRQIELWRIGGNKINTLESIYMNVTSFVANLDHNAKKIMICLPGAEIGASEP